MIYVPQIDIGDCGIACVKTLLATLSKDKNYMYLPEKEGKQNYSLQELANYAKKNGLTLEGIEVKEKESILKSDKLPMIIALELPNNGKHMVIVEKIKGKKIKIYDPDFGTYWSKLKEIEENWDGKALIVSNYEKATCPVEPIEIVKPKSMFIPYLLQFISGVLGILGLLFYKPEEELTIPIILLSLAVITAIIMKSLTFKVMKSNDFFLNEHIGEVKNTNFYTFFERFEKFKGLYFSTSLNLIFYIMFVTFIIFVSIFNNPINFVIIIAPIVVECFDYLFVKPTIDKRARAIEQQEKSLLGVKNEIDFEKKVNFLHEESYKFSRLCSLRKTISIFIIAIASLLVSAISTSGGLTNLIFYFCLGLFLVENIRPILSYEQNDKEIKKLKMQINNILRQNEIK